MLVHSYLRRLSILTRLSSLEIGSRRRVRGHGSWAAGLLLVDAQDSGGVARHEVCECKVALAHHRRARRVLRQTVQLTAHVLESRACEAAHVETQAQEVGVEQRSNERVTEQQCTDKHARKDGDLCVRHKAHRTVIVLLDPGLNHLGSIAARHLCRTIRVTRCGDHCREDCGTRKGEQVEKGESDVWQESDWSVVTY